MLDARDLLNMLRQGAGQAVASDSRCWAPADESRDPYLRTGSSPRNAAASSRMPPRA
jgi:hypothetical protein